MTRTSLYIRMINYNSIQCLPKRYYQLNMAFNTEITSFLRILTNRCEIKQKKKRISIADTRRRGFIGKIVSRMRAGCVIVIVSCYVNASKKTKLME